MVGMVDFWYVSLRPCYVLVCWCPSSLSFSIRSLGSRVTLCMPLYDSLFSFLELCLMAVICAAVVCAIDALVCICVGLFVHGVWSSQWVPKFICLQVLFMGMCAKVFMSLRSVHGKLLWHLKLEPSSFSNFYTSTKFEFQWHTGSLVFYIYAEFQGMCSKNCVLCSKYVPQIFHDCQLIIPPVFWV